MAWTASVLVAAGLLLWQGCSRAGHAPRGASGVPLLAPNAPAAPAEVVRDEAGGRMDRYLEAAQHFGFSGAVLVADPNGVVLRKGYGPADNLRRLSADMVLDMGSITKRFTAAAASPPPTPSPGFSPKLRKTSAGISSASCGKESLPWMASRPEFALV